MSASLFALAVAAAVAAEVDPPEREPSRISGLEALELTLLKPSAPGATTPTAEIPQAEIPQQKIALEVPQQQAAPPEVLELQAAPPEAPLREDRPKTTTG